MSDELNPNSIAADVVKGLITGSVNSLSKTLKGSIRKILDIFHKDLTSYVSATEKKCRFVRTPIINRGHSTPIFDIYVQTRLRVRNKVIVDTEFVAALSGSDSVVITGTAGSGKSVFMKYLFLKLYNNTNTKIPLLFELRDINESLTKDLQTFLYYKLIGPGAIISKDQFVASLKAGVFCLILDGFDEINFGDRTDIERQIGQLRTQCPELQLIISSRPDPQRRFDTWSSFDVIEVEPLDGQQVLELITKLDYDEKIKSKFTNSLFKGLLHTHRSFLSNPLLCVLMLVTFEQSGHIPNKRHLFYERAFDALAFLHDSAKEGGYKRRTYTALPSDEFKNCMSAFGIVTYVKGELTLTRRELRASLSEALQIERKKIDLDDLIKDMIESTCLIQEDGTDFVFTHRSFQEYFAAVFLARGPASAASIWDAIVSRSGFDDVLPMAFSINRPIVERQWILPRVDFLREQTKQLMDDGNFVGAASVLFGDLRLSDNRKVEVRTGRERHVREMPYIEGLYPEMFGAVSGLSSPIFRQLVSSVTISRPSFLRAFEFEVQNADLSGTIITQFLSAYLDRLGDLVANVRLDAKSQADILSRLLGAPQEFDGNSD
jgi:hypothetical protein